MDALLDPRYAAQKQAEADRQRKMLLDSLRSLAPQAPATEPPDQRFGYGEAADLNRLPPSEFDATPALPPSPRMFQQASSRPPREAPTVLAGAGLEGMPRSYMERTPGGQGMGGNEWAKANQGAGRAVNELAGVGGFRRPTEELYKQAFRPNQVIGEGREAYEIPTMAPGAGQFAQAELKGRVGAEDFARLLGQKEQETVRDAEAQLAPPVQEAAECAAQRATYPARVQGEAMGLQAMFGLQGREATAAGTVESRRATRDSAALNYLQRSLDELMGREEQTPETQSMISEVREQLQQLRRGEFFLTDFGFSEDEIEDMAAAEAGDLQ